MPKPYEMNLLQLELNVSSSAADRSADEGAIGPSTRSMTWAVTAIGTPGVIFRLSEIWCRAPGFFPGWKIVLNLRHIYSCGSKMS